MKEVSFGLESLNDNGCGFKINITLHPTMRGKCDFDISYICDYDAAESVGVLMEHDDIDRLMSLLSNARNESYKRLPEVEDDDFEVNLEDLFGGDDD